MTDRAAPTSAAGDGPSRVRPYALVRGRTRAAGPAPALPVETIVATTEVGARARPKLEAGRILTQAMTPTSVAELSAHLRLPVGVVRVLVSDLAEAGQLRLHLPIVEVDSGEEQPPEREILERCLAGLQAL